MYVIEPTAKIRPAILALEKEETAVFPIERLRSVRAQASELGAIYNRVFTTQTDREARTISVTRLK